MKIGIFGTGVVGQSIAVKLLEIGQDVMVGTREVAKTLARTEPDSYGRPPISALLKQHLGLKIGTFADAARHGEILINATNGMGSLEVLNLAGESHLKGKILIDIANPLDFSKGMPPSLFVCNTDSLGEQIQRHYPAVKVVKTLNTVTAGLMVDPRRLAGGEHHIFVSGDDQDARAQVTHYLTTWFGWKHIIDLGDITSARATEMYLPIWLRLYGALGTGMFNIQVTM